MKYQESRQDNKTIVVGTRIKVSTFNLLNHISKHTKQSKGALVRAALTEWLRNMPEDLPLDLKIEVARTNIQHQIDTIKNLRWTYHQVRTANLRLQGIEREQLPPHTAETIKQLEQTIITLQNQLDQWIKQQYQKGQQP